MTDDTSRRAGATGRGRKARDSAGEGDSGPKSARPAHDGGDPEDVTDPAPCVEAQGGLGEGSADGDSPHRWTRRAIAGGLLLAAGGAAFGLWPRSEPGGRGSRVVPLTPPRRPATTPAPTDLPPGQAAPQEIAAGGVAAEEAAAVPPEAAPPSLEAAEVPPLKAPGGAPQIAIVIDDLGLLHAESRRAVDLPAPLTLAFLPYGDSIAALTERARTNGHEVIVHLPMEPEGRADPGPEALRLGLGAGELEKRLRWNLTRVPGHAGVNNHMGSAMTENAAAMELVLERLKQDGGYFLDSRTTARSTARAIAARIGLPYAERDVFLDNSATPAAIRKQLAEAEALARRYGTAIAIGHPHPQTLAVLNEWLPEARQKGFDLVPVSTIIATRGSPLWRLARDRKGTARS